MIKYLIVGEVVFLALFFSAGRGRGNHVVPGERAGIVYGAVTLSIVLWPITAAIFAYTFFKVMRRI